jgi:MFS family permease
VTPNETKVAALRVPPHSGERRAAGGRLQIGFYFGALTLAAGLGQPDGLLRLPVQFWLKDQLGASPHQLAIFEALACAPVYVAFFFGFLRDHWSPFRWRDRGYLILSSLLAIGCYTWLAAGRLDYFRLLIAVLLAGAAYQLMHAAAEALMTSVAQRRSMTGRLSALSEFAEAIAGVMAALAGGWMVSHASMRTVFLITAAVTAVILLQGFWKPRAVFASNAKVIPQEGLRSIVVLLRHRALWPSAVIIMLWSFSPGYHTPMLYYLTENVRISSTAYGVCQAVDCIGITAATALYAWLCGRVPLRRLLWWSMGLSIFPGVVFLFVHNAPQAIAASFLLAVMIGFMNTSIGDLLMRAAPEGLEGSYRMFGVSAFAVGGAIGDVSGAWVYEHGGLIPCLILEAVVTICIFPALRWLPPNLIESCETRGAEAE